MIIGPVRKLFANEEVHESTIPRCRDSVAAVTLSAAGVTVGKPEEVGLSSERLQRIDEVIQRYIDIDAKEISGAVTVVARKGRVAHFEAQGLMDIESKSAMRKDTIFRIASMSKPVTGVAIMMLLEDGRIRLDDPVSRFIPEFKDTKVAMPEGPPRLSACRSLIVTFQT
jgi:CubicO group peptidase (beta-lactamase class C family)